MSRWALILLGVLLLPFGASAQEARPDDVQSAAAAFGEAQRAQLRGDYAQAADLFELADRSAPNPAALRSAIRNRRAASQTARAATLAAEAIARYPDDVETHALATETLAELSPSLAAVHVSCTPACSLAIDGRAAHDRALERFEIFVEPGSHELAASWGGSPVTRTLTAVPAEDEAIAFEEPLAEEEVEEEIEDGVVTSAVPPPPPASGLHPGIFGGRRARSHDLVGRRHARRCGRLSPSADGGRLQRRDGARAAHERPPRCHAGRGRDGAGARLLHGLGWRPRLERSRAARPGPLPFSRGCVRRAHGAILSCRGWRTK